ncbi:exodeoxyribonuclease VII small subunit [Novosphingobium taihuense]|uniref:Exodeoxyribonuclease 7 small subunit n=1 Tax=Novosphingobium taihuense TaxID=260085 RepID=A0A7W7A959_9SPHN|nr:exodeoxyribonuclease VII small subunit [Novosphingobium taihuense]MBB4612626.1 exodeoxyribonuclease VII small subunit [Novosphingobium taihuense]TWH88023.1 exodeoxyribonuclease VII small subunit [Novosphingobium taihuense]
MGTGPEIASLSFEEALKELENVVRRLESGDAPLDESIDLYARGDALRAHCQARLDAAQARIEAIVADRDGKPQALRAFDEAQG